VKGLVRSLVLVAGLFLAGAAQAQGADQREVLSADVKPAAYDLHLVPDPDHMTFKGEVAITVDVAQPTAAITLNADHLTFDRAVLDGAGAPAAASYDAKLQRATLDFGRPVAAGRHVLTIAYHGEIGRTTLGFFAMDYDTAQGRKRMLATNFEPADERDFMPSWDEPGDKATFTLTVDAAPGQMPVSNMPIASSEALPNGLVRSRFETSPRMSTYLIFFGLGDFERITTEVDGTTVGVVVRRGETEKGRYALGEAAKLLHFYNTWFGVKYPLPKLDLIAAPGEIQGGSMENWGAIFYSGEHLLFDPKFSTESDRQLVFLVVAHEMAHQWFGDLVTMAWWDNLWLNEGFARWMQTKAAVELHPEWRTGLQALAIYDGGKRADAAPGTHPIVQPVLTAEQADEAFDAITYNKGAAVITMLEAYAGPEHFREGVHRYMEAHRFGNSVDADLWSQVQAASGKPILEVEHQFTTTVGVPLITVDKDEVTLPASRAAYEGDGYSGPLYGSVTLTEGRFFADSAMTETTPSHWTLPLRVSAGGQASAVLLHGDPQKIDFRPAGAPLVINDGQTAYARVLYPDDAFDTLSHLYGTLTPFNQAGVMYDTYAEGQAGYAPLSRSLRLVSALPADADPIVWRQAVNLLAGIDDAYGDDPRRAAFETFARRDLTPIAAKVGWQGAAGEDPAVSSLRVSVLAALGRFDDEATVAQARTRFAALLQNAASLDPTTRRTVIAIVARHADASTFDQLLAMVRGTNDPLQRQRLLEAMATASDDALAQRVLDETLTPDTPAGLAPSLIGTVARNHPDLAWRFVIAHYGKPDLPIDTDTALRLAPGVAGESADLKRIDELNAWAEAHVAASSRRPVDAAVAAIRRNAKFRAERIGPLDSWLKGQAQ
jgi:aminopeptidase N